MSKPSRKPQPALKLKVVGPHVHSGRIKVPDLLVICQHAQQAVNRQAEALGGEADNTETWDQRDPT